MKSSDLIMATQDEPRLAIEVDLRPVQGSRFQATGFPDLGPAIFQRPDGTDMLLVESAQSMANRLEALCWDEGCQDLVPELAGLPYVRVVTDDGRFLTSSLLEAHRVNSPYILEGRDTTFLDLLKDEARGLDWGPVDRARLASMVFRYDPNSIVHGAFLAKKELAGGRLRLPRALSAFVEAEDVREAESGGVKNDHVDPSGDARRGFGNVPFHRTEFTARRITAFFDLDLALLRGYRLPAMAYAFTVTLSLWKIRRFLAAPVRFRTACDLEPVEEPRVTRPQGLELPSVAELDADLPAAIAACQQAGRFVKPPVTEVRWAAKPDKAGTGEAETEA